MIARLIASFGANFGPWILSALALYAGYLFGDRHTAQCHVNMETLKVAYATQYATAQAQASRYQADLVDYGNRLSGQLALEREQHAAETATLKRSIQRVTTLYRPAPDAPARPLPECIVTAGAVRLWNAATGARAGAADADAAPGGADPATDPADLTDSGVRLSDLLAHHADYAQRCRDIEAQLIRAIDYLQADPANLPDADHAPSELEEVAQVLEQAERDAGVAEVREQLPSGPGSIHCHDCGGVIPEARRQAFTGVKTCVPCQSLRDGTSYHRQ